MFLATVVYQQNRAPFLRTKRKCKSRQTQPALTAMLSRQPKSRQPKGRNKLCASTFGVRILLSTVTARKVERAAMSSCNCTEQQSMPRGEYGWLAGNALGAT